MTTPYRNPATRPYYAPDFDKETGNAAIEQLSKLRRSKVLRGVSAFNVAALVLSVATMSVMGVVTEGCSLFTPQTAQTVLDVAKVACIIANAESDVAVVKTVCGVVDAEDNALHAILGEQRKASRRFASSKAAACAPSTAMCDAGVCAEAGSK